MKHKIVYECRVGGNSFKSEFEVESQSAPEITDGYLTELALKHSIEFHKSGQGGIEIVSVERSR